MTRHSALSPIFDPGISYGHVVVGTPVGSVVPESPPDPPTPELFLVGSVQHATTLDRVDSVIVDGTEAYLGSSPNDRFIVCNVSNPAVPTITTSVTSSSKVDNVSALAVWGNYLLVLSPIDFQVYVYDISTPATPTDIGSNYISSTQIANATDIQVLGNYAFIAGSPSGNDRFVILDLTTIAPGVGPTFVASVTDSRFNLSQRLAVSGTLGFQCASTEDRLVIVDFSTIGSPSIVGSLQDATNLNNAHAVIVDGTVAYVVNSSTPVGLSTIDVSTPSAPTLLDHINVTGAFELAKIGDYVFITDDSTDTVRSVNVADPTDLVLGPTLSITELDGVDDIVTDGTYLYCACFAGDRLTILGFTAGVATPPPVTGWRPLMFENFDTTVTLGTATASGTSTSLTAYPNIGVYPTTYFDTSSHLGRPAATAGQYDANATVSVSGGILTKHLHTVGTRPKVCALLPQLPTSDPAVTASGLWTYQLYGRYEIVARFPDIIAGYKVAWLTWPISGGNAVNGEIDFPEHDLNQQTHTSAFVHHAPSTPSPFQHGSGSIAVDLTAWHTFTTEWTPGLVEFFIDGVSVFDDNDRIPAAPMRWVIQTETQLSSTPPSTSAAGDVEIDSVAVWAYDP